MLCMNIGVQLRSIHSKDWLEQIAKYGQGGEKRSYEIRQLGTEESCSSPCVRLSNHAAGQWYCRIQAFSTITTLVRSSKKATEGEWEKHTGEWSRGDERIGRKELLRTEPSWLRVLWLLLELTDAVNTGMVIEAISASLSLSLYPNVD